MKAKILFSLLLLISVIACGSGERSAEFSVVEVKENLKSYLFSKFDDFQITEIFSKYENKKTFLEDSLGSEFTRNITTIESQELLFKELSSETDSHIGFVVITYSCDIAAQKAIGSIYPTGFFENTKILTRYVSANKDEINLVIYTESAADKQVLVYLDQYSKILQKK
ncbi:MAG: hypothetical protein KAR13_17920 [Desulfobulbaceae bacterium]|nr:hypothetical protein [Desulfobulbaceae bacterium]